MPSRLFPFPSPPLPSPPSLPLFLLRPLVPFAMHVLGLSSMERFKKCVRVVWEVRISTSVSPIYITGFCYAKFHQHGDNDDKDNDAVVHESLDFSLRFPLIQGYGNFGTIDEDPPAAMRYTACRLDVFIIILAHLNLCCSAWMNFLN
ncbi:hypothetical protein Pint_06035 [Pistacia integerrima]|uniref:Uncharacterized protein n=1 Tax=Pistacia integerrima TaxID=434235 RepID=A0ACC0Z9X1_9ROSI|nr:hypothetical protein Pint_06035 [Pistacia integerrima]